MSPPTFSDLLEPDLVQRVGTRLELTVSVEPDQKGGKVFFEWRGPATSSTEDGRVNISEQGNLSTATIIPLSLQDQGIWTCSAKNKHGIAQTKCNVIAQVPKSYKAPVFLEELTAGITEVGTVSLECKVVGIPSPTLKWFRDGEEIKSGDVFALQARFDKPVSVYRCDAFNCMGTVSSTAVLDVSKSINTQSTAPPTLLEGLTDKKVKIGEIVELSVTVTRLSLPVRVVWANHGNQIAVGDKYSVAENGEGRFSVIINPVELCDDGEWKVNIENRFGVVSSEATLTLRVPKNYRRPKFVEDLKAVLTKEGLVSFECKVVGFPTPVLRWFKDGSELKPGDVYQLSGSKSLGTYSCLARNCMGEGASTASLTVEDIGEKFPDTKSQLRFLVPLQDTNIKIGETQRFSVQVTYSPCLEIWWKHKEEKVVSGNRVNLSREDGGYFHCDIKNASTQDEGEWSVVAKDSSNEIKSSCILAVNIPKHYKKPRFLEPLKAVLTEEGAVNLECKVIGVPQPVLSWYKDGVELKAGDIHRLMSGADGTCCLGTYTCVATNCMGNVTSSAALLGYEEPNEIEHAISQDLQTPDISDGNLKPFSLSTIQEERTSQMFSPEAQENTNQHSETLQNSTEDHEPISISIGKADAAGDLSISIGNQELTLSLYQTPDLTERDARHVCEMFAEELAESVTESKYVELPPLRFMRETAKSSNINMEAIIIDIDQQGFEEYESLRLALENVDDLKTEADIDEVSMAEWIEEPVNVREYEALACEEIFELDDDRNEIVQIITESEKLQMLSESNIKKEEVYSPDVTSASLGKDENSVSKDLISDSLTKKQKEVKEKAVESKQKSAQKPASHSTSNTENSQKEQDNNSLISAPGNELPKNSIKTDSIQTHTEEKNNEIKDMNSELKITEANISETLAIIEESKLEKNDLSSKHNIHENAETPTTHDSKPVSSTSERGEVKEQDEIVNDTVAIDQQNSSKIDQSESLISKNQEDEPLEKMTTKESIIFTANETRPEEKITIISNEIEKSINKLTFPEEKKQIETEELITEASIKTLNKQEPAEVSAQVGLIVKIEEESLTSSNEDTKYNDSTANKTKDSKRKENENESRTDDQKTNDIETVTSKVDGSDEKIASKVEENKEVLTGQGDITTEQTKQEESSTVKEKSVVNVTGIIRGDNTTETTIDDAPDFKDPKLSGEEKIETKLLENKDKGSTIETETEEVTKTTENESTSSSSHVISDLGDKILNKEVVVGDQNSPSQPNEGFEGALTKKQKEIKEKALASKKKSALASPQLTSKTDSKSKDAVSSIGNNLEEQILPTDPLMEEKSKDNPEAVKIPAKRTALEILALDILEIHKPIFEMTQIPELTREVVEQSKPVTRQASVVDSESLPDIETFNKDDPIKAENKDVLDDDDEDFEFDEEAYRRQRRASSYEDAIANMDPDILKELGISTGDTVDKSSNEQFDLDQLPVETTMERMSRIEEKALKIALEEDIVPRKSRSRSRSRSKSRPPGLDTVIEKSKEEKAEAKYYEEKGLMALPSLDTIKESPSTASVAGLLYGGFSSASINTVLQGSQSSASVHKDLEDMATLSPCLKQKFEHDKIKEVDELAIENFEPPVSSLNTEKDNLSASQIEPKDPNVSCSNIDNITSHQNEPEAFVMDETEVLGRNEQCEQIAANSALEKDLMDKSRIDSGIEVSTQDEDSVKPVTKSRKKKAQRTQTKQILPGNEDDEKLLDINSMTDEPQEYTSNLETSIENATVSETPAEHQKEKSDLPQLVSSSELIKEMKLDLTSDINESVKETVDKTVEPFQNEVEPHEKTDKKKTIENEDIALVPELFKKEDLKKEIDLDLTSNVDEIQSVKESVLTNLDTVKDNVDPFDKAKIQSVKEPVLTNLDTVKDNVDLFDKAEIQSVKEPVLTNLDTVKDNVDPFNKAEIQSLKESVLTNLDPVKDNVDPFNKADTKENKDMVSDVCSNNKLGDKDVLNLVSDTNEISKNTASEPVKDQVEQFVNAEEKNNQESENKKNVVKSDVVQQEHPESTEVSDDLNTNKKEEQSSEAGIELDTGNAKEKTAMFIVPGYVEKDDDLLEGPEFDSVIINTNFTEAENKTSDLKKDKPLSLSKAETEKAMNLEEEIINKQGEKLEIESKTLEIKNNEENKKLKEEESINQEEEIKKKDENIEKDETALRKQKEERKRQEDEIRKQEELKRQEDEIKSLEEERKKQEEEENKKKVEEDRKRQEENEIRRQKEEEEIRKREEKKEKERKQEEEKKKKEEKRKEEEEKTKEEIKRKALEEEEKHKQAEKEKAEAKTLEEEKIKREKEEKKLEEEKIQREKEKHKQAEKEKAEAKTSEEEKIRREKEEKKLEEEKIQREEEKHKQAEKEKAEAKTLEEEKIRREKEERKLEEEKIQREKEQKKLEEEKRKMLEEKKKEADEKAKQEMAKKAEIEEQERKEKEEKAKKELAEKRLREELEMKKKLEETAKKEAEEKSRKEEVERKKREKEVQEKTRKEEEEARLKEEERKEFEKKKKEEQRIKEEKKMEEEKAKQILKEKEEKLQEIERQKVEEKKKKEAEDKKIEEKERKEAQENKNKKESGEKIPTSDKKTKASRKGKQTVDQKKTPERHPEEKSEHKDVKKDLSKGFEDLSKSNLESLGNSQSADVMNAYYKAQKSDTYSMKSFGTETKDSGYLSSQGGCLSSSERSKFDYGLENQHSSSYDSRARNISGDSYYKETVEKSMQTSNNLMSMVTGSLAPKPEPSRPKPQPQKVEPKNKASESRMNKSKAEESKTTPPGGVSDIMIKEVGCNWVSLCWKKPAVTRGSPILTYKVEAWLCGEGAFWVEIGRTPIPQYDVFNLKPNKCYHFRVTARNKQGWGDSIMTTHKVDLNKPTQMPKISSEHDPIVKTFNGSDLRLAVSVSGEPSPSVKWMRDNEDINTLEGYNVYQDEIGCYVEISNIDSSYAGKYTVTASNLAGRASKSIMVQVLNDENIYQAYSKFKSWQHLVRTPLPPFMLNGPRDRRVQTGLSIQLTCRVIGNPWPHVRWFKDDDQIIPDDYTNVYNEGDFQHVQIDDITMDHQGKYSVEAFNEHGIITSHFTVIVDNGLERYMPPFFTRELSDIFVRKGCNLLLHCRVESFPYIGVTWHESGSKIRLRETDYKIVDEDGNVILVIANATETNSYSCTIINEIAENSTSCLVTVVEDQHHLTVDEDLIRHSLTPRFLSWPKNQFVSVGETVTIECTVDGCNSIWLSRELMPQSIDLNVKQLNKSGNTFSIQIPNISLEQSGLYFITARNSHCEEKYPVIIRVQSHQDLNSVDTCAIENSCGAPVLQESGPLYTRDGDNVVIKASLHAGQPPFNISWKFNNKAVVWSERVQVYNKPGCIGVQLTRVGVDDEGTYTCTVSNSHGSATYSATLLVDYAEHKESEIMVELCNCPMLDTITPLMSWTNTPIATPRRTPIPTPHGTPLMTPRATPRCTPRTTPRATPTPSLGRRGYDYRSPSVCSNYSTIDDLILPPPRRKFVQAPEIFSSFSSKNADEGSMVEFKCFISCAPLTTTTWEKDNMPVISGSHIVCTEKTGVRILTVHDIRVEDAGNYRMTITNKSGVSTCSAVLTVKRKKLVPSSQLTATRSTYSRGRSYNTYSYNSVRYL